MVSCLFVKLEPNCLFNKKVLKLRAFLLPLH